MIITMSTIAHITNLTDNFGDLLGGLPRKNYIAFILSMRHFCEVSDKELLLFCEKWGRKISNASRKRIQRS